MAAIKPTGATVAPWPTKEHAAGWDMGAGESKTIITLTAAPGPKSAAKVADAVRYLQAKYPGAEIRVKGLEQ